MPARLNLAMAAFLCVSLTASAASAEGLFLLRDTLFEVSPEYNYNNFVFPDAADKMQMVGLRIHERNGIAGRVFATAIVGIIMALGASDREYVGSEYGYGYRIDYYRMKSSEEMAQEAAAREEAIDATASNEYQFDLRFYVRDDRWGGYSNGEGFILTLFPWSWGDGGWVFEFGFQVAYVYGLLKPGAPSDTPADTGGQPANSNTGLPADSREQYQYTNVGMPFRLIVPILSPWVYLDNEWDVNFLWVFGKEEGKHDSYDAPFRSNLTLNLTERVFLRGGPSISAFSGDAIGYQAEAGIRF
jgi:hypothetical protein